MQQFKRMARSIRAASRHLVLVALLVAPLTSVGCECIREYREITSGWSVRVRWAGSSSGDEGREGGGAAGAACLISLGAMRFAASNSH